MPAKPRKSAAKKRPARTNRTTPAKAGPVTRHVSDGVLDLDARRSAMVESGELEPFVVRSGGVLYRMLPEAPLEMLKPIAKLYGMATGGAPDADVAEAMGELPTLIETLFLEPDEGEDRAKVPTISLPEMVELIQAYMDHQGLGDQLGK